MYSPAETSPDSGSSRLRDSPSAKDAAGSPAFPVRVSTPPAERPKSPFSGLGKSPDGTLYATPDVRLHHRAVLVAAGDDATGALGGLVRQLSIDQFENESRRVSIGTPGAGDSSVRRTTPTFDRTAAVAGIHKSVLAVLLRPREWRPQLDRCARHCLQLFAHLPAAQRDATHASGRRFFLDINMIRELCERAEACLAQDRCGAQRMRVMVRVNVSWSPMFCLLALCCTLRRP